MFDQQAKESPPKTTEQVEIPKEPDTKPVAEDTIVPVPKEGEKLPPKVVRKQEVTVEGQNLVEQETDHIKEVKVIKKVVKKESGEPPRFSRPIQPQVSTMRHFVSVVICHLVAKIQFC